MRMSTCCAGQLALGKQYAPDLLVLVSAEASELVLEPRVVFRLPIVSFDHFLVVVFVFLRAETHNLLEISQRSVRNRTLNCNVVSLVLV